MEGTALVGEIIEILTSGISGVATGVGSYKTCSFLSQIV